jgi:dienelactone hydrolase
MPLHRWWPIPLILFVVVASSAWLGWSLHAGNITLPFLQNWLGSGTTPWRQDQPQPDPYLAWSIPQLTATVAQEKMNLEHNLKIERLVASQAAFTTYEFSFLTLGKKMTGQLNIPISASSGISSASSAAQTNAWPVIVLVRGYVPPASYQLGVGTKNAAAVFAKAGYVTFAPDFFGYGQSDPEESDQWLARFQKPIEVLDLLKAIEQNQSERDQSAGIPRLDSDRIGIWAHSNGGQIALTTLEISQGSWPTTLWAPVTAPFPYSILYFSDEDEDEGRASRAQIAQFELNHSAFDYSLTQFLTQLHGPLQIHHGSNDDSALQSWSTDFVKKLKMVNPSIDLTYYRYPGADHNLQPNWATAIQRDLDFFAKH